LDNATPPRRAAFGEAARRIVEAEVAWPSIAARMIERYRRLTFRAGNTDDHPGLRNDTEATPTRHRAT